MKTLEELNDILTDLPCPFAAASDWDDQGFDFPPARQDSPCTNYETGIPQKYAQDKESEDELQRGELIPRHDFNRLGNLASRELFLCRCGSWHTFDSNFSAENLGYAQGALLVYDDGKYLCSVESQVKENTINFVANPKVINNLVNNGGAELGILWKSANRVYGLEQGFTHIGVDFSRRQNVSKGSRLRHDSLVLVGANACEEGIWGTESDITWAGAISGGRAFWENAVKKATCGEFQVALYIGGMKFTFPCKGMQGYSLSPMMLAEAFVFGIDKIPEWYSRICGGASFPLAFFAKSDTVISWEVKGGPSLSKIPDDSQPFNGDRLSVVAYPIEASVSKGVEQ